MNKKKVTLLLSLFILLLCCISMLLLSMCNNKKEKIIPIQYTIEDDFYLMQEPGYPKDYILNRTPSDTWGEDEVTEWFLFPDENVLKQVEDENNKLVRNILEGAP